MNFKEQTKHFINISQNLLENKLYNYIGNCINSFDENGNCLFDFFIDIIDFAQLEEKMQKISKKEFENKV